MQARFEVRYLKRPQIDVLLWNTCIHRSPNGLIYAQSFLLDAMADNWDALVLNDYEAVMPLPWRKKGGIRYVYQVPFLQRLGIYGVALSDEIITAFYQQAIKHFRFINYKTDVLPLREATILARCNNFFIPLSPAYQVLENNFTPECKKNIRKAESRGCVLQQQVPVAHVIKMFQDTYGSFYPDYDATVYNQLSYLIEQGITKGWCRSFAVTDEQGELVFTAALLQDSKRLYYIMGAPTEKGRHMRAAYFFISEILRQYAGKSLCFDFEGSDIPNVAAFYTKFGPVAETYYDIKINKLLPPLRWLKR